MMKAFVYLHCRRNLLIVCIISLVCLSALSSASAEGTVSEQAKAVICGKGRGVVVLGAHGFDSLQTNRLAVPYNPMIFDIDGRAIGLDELKVPCQGEVEYRQSGDKEPELFRIRVRAYENNASTRFTEKDTKKKLPE
jgi:hypothetical protein